MSLVEKIKAVEQQLGKPDISQQLSVIGTRVDAAIAQKQNEVATTALKEARALVANQEAGDAKTALEAALAETEERLRENETKGGKGENGEKETKGENGAGESGTKLTEGTKGEKGTGETKVTEVTTGAAEAPKPAIQASPSVPVPTPAGGSRWSNPFADFASWNPFKGIGDRRNNTFVSPVTASKTVATGSNPLSDLEDMGNDIDKAGGSLWDKFRSNFGFGSPKPPPPMTV